MKLYESYVAEAGLGAAARMAIGIVGAVMLATVALAALLVMNPPGLARAPLSASCDESAARPRPARPVAWPAEGTAMNETPPRRRTPCAAAAGPRRQPHRAEDRRQRRTVVQRHFLQDAMDAMVRRALADEPVLDVS